MEKLSKLGNLLHIDVESGKIHVDPELISEYLLVITQFSELAIDSNPDFQNSDWNYELTMGISNGYDQEELKTKIDKMKSVDFVDDVILLSPVILVVKFPKNTEVMMHF